MSRRAVPERSPDLRERTRTRRTRVKRPPPAPDACHAVRVSKQSRRASRRDRPKGRRSRLAPSAGESGLRLVVATSPSDFDDGRFLAHDLQLIRSALLYADTVELLSPAALMVGSVAVLEQAGGDGWMALLSSLDDDTLTHLGVDGDLTEWRQAVAGYQALSSLPRAERRRLLGQHNAGMQQARNEFERLVRSPGGVSKTLNVILEKAGAPELVEAVESGVLTLNWDFMELGADTDTQIAQYTDKLKSLLSSPNEHLLLDDRIGGIARSLLEEGHVVPHDLTFDRATRSQVGTGLVSRLPAFPNASVASVLKARVELSEALTNYRAGVTKVSERIRSGPFDESLQHEVTDLWRDEVAPAVDRLSKDLSSTRLLRDAAVNLAVDAKTAMSAAAMFFGVDTFTHVHQALAAGAAGLPVVGKAAASAYKESADRRDASHRHEFFYLLELERRL